MQRIDGPAWPVSLFRLEAATLGAAPQGLARAMAFRIASEVLARFESSLARCINDPAFLVRFYDRFILVSDEVARRFEGIDVKRQARVLRTSLYLVARAASGFDDGVRHLEEIARTHDRRGYDIRPELYEHWLQSLLAVVEVVDPEYTTEVGEAWESTLRPCIDLMVSAWKQS